MYDAAPIAAPPVRQMVQPSAITIIAEEFGFRRNGIDKAHVRTLAQALRNGGGKLDPILLWREVGPSGETGRLILLDGEHRFPFRLPLHGLLGPVAQGRLRVP